MYKLSYEISCSDLHRLIGDALCFKGDLYQIDYYRDGSKKRFLVRRENEHYSNTNTETNNNLVTRLRYFRSTFELQNVGLLTVDRTWFGIFLTFRTNSIDDVKRFMSASRRDYEPLQQSHIKLFYKLKADQLQTCIIDGIISSDVDDLLECDLED